jgi:tetratricopeptide (TPR) repeat protein
LRKLKVSVHEEPSETREQIASGLLNKKGKALADLGSYEAAIEAYDKALKLRPDYL